MNISKIPKKSKKGNQTSKGNSSGFEKGNGVNEENTNRGKAEYGKSG